MRQINILKNLSIIFFALFAGQVIYFLVGIFMIQQGTQNEFNEPNMIFLLLAPVITVSVIFVSRFIYSKQLNDFDMSSSLDDKLKSYQNINIIRLALLEGANIFNISLLIITSNYFFAALFVIPFAVFMLSRPSKDRFILDYQVAASDAAKIIE